MKGNNDTIGDAGRAEAARRAILAGFFLNGTVFGTWATHIPAIKTNLDLGAAAMGTALLFLAVGALAAMIASGPLLARRGSAAMTRLTGVAFALLLPLPSLMPGYLPLCLVLALFGVAGGTMDVAMNAHGALVERRLGRPVMSSLHGMWSLGGLFGAGIGGPLLTILPPVVQAALVSALLLVPFLALQRNLLKEVQDSGGTALALPDRNTLLLGCLMLLAFLCEGAVLDWSAIYLRDSLGAAALSGLGFAVFSGAMAVGRFGGDWLRQHFGGPVLVRTGGLLAAAGMGLAVLGGEPLAAILGFGLAGLGLSNVVPVLFSAAGAVRSGSAAHAVAAVSTLGYTGILIGPVAVGFVAEATSLTASFGLVALLVLVVAAAAGRAVPAQPDQR